jgi:uncharacterized membrane protein (DUF373 family)
MASGDAAADLDGQEPPLVDRLVDKGLAVVETSIYAVVALSLVAGAALLLVSGIGDLVSHADDGVEEASIDLLNSLLLVFIFAELLAAVRATVRERELVAEPFLIVGIIASIKEIVLIGAGHPRDEDFESFRNAMIEIGALTGVVVTLAIAALLLRRRQREPPEQRATE